MNKIIPLIAGLSITGLGLLSSGCANQGGASYPEIQESAPKQTGYAQPDNLTQSAQPNGPSYAPATTPQSTLTGNSPGPNNGGSAATNGHFNVGTDPTLNQPRPMANDRGTSQQNSGSGTPGGISGNTSVPGTANAGTSNNGNLNTGSTNTGSTNTGSSGTGSTGTGSTNTGSTGTGSTGTGSTNTGSTGTGTGR